jgi:hypothetical protein
MCWLFLYNLKNTGIINAPVPNRLNFAYAPLQLER